jgi:hypothetical protein
VDNKFIFVKLLPSASQRAWLLVKKETEISLILQTRVTERNAANQRAVKA